MPQQKTYSIRSAEGDIVFEDLPQKTLQEFHRRHSQCRIVWGHHYRVMKRRTDPPEVVHECRQKECPRKGEVLWAAHPNGEEGMS